MNRGSYRGYSTVDKEALIVECTFRPLREVARECKIPESTLRGWKRKFEEEGVLPKAKKKAIGGGQKPLMPPSVEEKLVEWIHERREAGVAITTYLVRGKALELFHDDNFKASDGWCCNFQKRWNLTTRTPTNQRANANVTVEERNDKVQSYWNTIIRIRTKHNIGPDRIKADR